MKGGTLETKMEILKVVSENPGKSTTKLFNACRLNSGYFLMHSKTLAQFGLLIIEESNDAHDKRRRPSIRITDKGLAVLKKYEEIRAILG